MVASATLDASGVPNWLEGFHQVANQPFHEIALQGYKLMVVEEDTAAAVEVLREAMRTRSFEGERLSIEHRLVATIALWLITGFGFATPLFLPLRRHKWHDVCDEPR